MTTAYNEDSVDLIMKTAAQRLDTYKAEIMSLDLLYRATRADFREAARRARLFADEIEQYIDFEYND